LAKANKVSWRKPTILAKKSKVGLQGKARRSGNTLFYFISFNKIKLDGFTAGKERSGIVSIMA